MSMHKSTQPRLTLVKPRLIVVVLASLLLMGCANTLGRVGVSVPIGGFGGVNVGINTNGTLSGSVGVGASRGGVSVGVGTSGSTQVDSK